MTARCAQVLVYMGAGFTLKIRRKEPRVVSTVSRLCRPVRCPSANCGLGSPGPESPARDHRCRDTRPALMVVEKERPPLLVTSGVSGPGDSHRAGLFLGLRLCPGHLRGLAILGLFLFSGLRTDVPGS